MMRVLKIALGSLSGMRPLLIWQLAHAVLTGAPVVFLFLAIIELQNKPPSPSRLAVICLALAALTLANVFLAVKVHVRTYVEGYALSTEARLKLGDHLRTLSLGFFKERDPGEISALMLQDMARVEHLLTHLLNEAAAMLALTALLGLCFLAQDLRLGGLMILTVALGAPALFWGQKLIAKFGARQLASRNKAASAALEYVQGMATLKTFNLTGRGFKRMEAALDRLKRDSIYLEAAAGLPIAVFSAILELGLAALLFAAVYLLSQGSVTAAVFILFVVVGHKFFEPLLSFSVFFSEIRYMSLAASRIASVLDQRPLPQKLPEAGPEGHGVEFKNVSFGYAPGREVIKDLSLNLPQGSLTALVGPSGSGKTTLASLMARFWDPDSGQIMIGGAPIKAIAPERLASLFSFVFQDVHLFQGSIYDNIAAGRRTASPEEVRLAAEKAACLDFIEALPNRFDTLVGEGGASLSGGERQRISVARAILKNAPIVVLDEATASLDPESELSMLKAVGELLRGKTVVVIAHRLRTVASADQLAVIEDGRMTEFGDHESLLLKGGAYAALWAEQKLTGGWRLPKKAPRQ
jgi:ATP-binding cassette subfamily B protein